MYPAPALAPVRTLSLNVHPWEGSGMPGHDNELGTLEQQLKI